MHSETQTRGTHGVKKKYSFRPPVTLSLKFVRENGVEETREASAFAFCNAADYDRYVSHLEPIGKEESSSFAVEETAVVDETFASPMKAETSDATTVAVLKLSPTEHRPRGSEDQAVRIGATTLANLHVIANFATNTLEIEEDEAYDD